ncbi:helix-turn-helix domain-containing protein [Halosolutus amylolyticus]|uniref:Helix-turn-helix domain-containing protein n=1 Tax=Halosolutus amylolyticus TaxID=2932267 RepID=A0ABD5PJB3_9EURY|nr:helix-turn-helix domain-containing protein [Halosolutus amylolyticus]
MYEATFRITGGVAYEEATRGTGATVELWCNDHCDLLYVSKSASDLVRRHIEDQVGITHVVEDGEETIIVTSECLKSRSPDHIESFLARHNCLLMPPIRYENGGKVCRVIAVDSKHLTRFYRDVQSEFTVTVESKREINNHAQTQPLVALGSSIPELSSQQHTALLTAHERGYYRIPRDATTAELADEMDIDRRTFEEHLRRAENKLIEALIEYLFK